MKKTTILTLAGLLALAAPAGAKEKRVKSPSEIDRLAAYAAPKDWQVERAAAPEPSLRFSLGPKVIRVRLFGGKGSAHASPELFLKRAGAPGRTPASSGTAMVAGKEVLLYQAAYAVGLGDPHARQKPAGMAEEQLVIVPAGGSGRFFVLSYAYDSPIPAPPSDTGERTWAEFLAAFKLK